MAPRTHAAHFGANTAQRARVLSYPAVMQHRVSWILGLSLFAIGCGDGSNSSSGSGEGSGSGGGDSTTNATMPGTSASATEAMTSAATGGTVDDTSTTASVDGTSSGTSESSSSSSGPAESSSSGAPEGPVYPPCMNDADPPCPEPFDHCYTFLPREYSVCSQMCREDEDCPQPQSGDAPAVCAGQADDECVLDCADGATCPDGMECVDVGGTGMFLRCAWPV
jgi:hypothetical protein